MPFGNDEWNFKNGYFTCKAAASYDPATSSRAGFQGDTPFDRVGPFCYYISTALAHLNLLVMVLAVFGVHDNRK
jgi:hypothetical protein